MKKYVINRSKLIAVWKGGSMKPLQISPETAIKLAEQLNVPIEHLMHMPQHILLQKIAQLAKDIPLNANQKESHTDKSSKDAE
jgi:hypothetical protein